MTSEAIGKVPWLGVGIGYRRELHDGIMENAAEIDFLEVITERYFGASTKLRKTLEMLTDRFVVIPHGVSLSLGSAKPVSRSMMTAIKDVCELVSPPYYSEHLAVTQSPGVEIGHLSPVVYNDETLRQVTDNINRLQDYLRLPLVVENITHTHEIPGSTLSEGEFFHRIVDSTGCGMLLDVTNLYTNSTNRGLDALCLARELPLGSVVQAHLAGGLWHEGKLIDSHSEAVPHRVWELLSELLPQTAMRGAIIERDSNYPQFAEMLAEIRMARQVFMPAVQPNRVANSG